MNMLDRFELNEFRLANGQIDQSGYDKEMESLFVSQARLERSIAEEWMGYGTFSHLDDVSLDTLEKEVSEKQHGFVLSQNVMDKYDGNCYVFSKQFDLYGYKEGDHIYIFNGRWWGKVIGNEFEILAYKSGDKRNPVEEIPDWETASGSEIRDMVGYYFFRPLHLKAEIAFPQLCDDIAF